MYADASPPGLPKDLLIRLLPTERWLFAPARQTPTAKKPSDNPARESRILIV